MVKKNLYRIAVMILVASVLFVCPVNASDIGQENSSPTIICNGTKPIDINGNTELANLTYYSNGDVAFSVDVSDFFHFTNTIDESVTPHDGSVSIEGITRLSGRVIRRLNRVESGLTINNPFFLIKYATANNWTIKGDTNPISVFKTSVTATNLIPSRIITINNSHDFLSIEDEGYITISIGGGTVDGIDCYGIFEAISVTVNLSDW